MYTLVKTKVLKRFCTVMPKNYSVKGLLKNNLFLPILQSKEPVLTKKKNLTTVLQVLKVFMEPFSQNGSSMAS